MTIVYACREGATLNSSGNCRNADREWIEVSLPEFGGTNPSLDPEIYATTFLAFFTIVATAYFAGMGIRSILRLIR